MQIYNEMWDVPFSFSKNIYIPLVKLVELKFFKCLAVMPPFTQKIFRPAEDCSICRDVQQVDRISDVDPSTFEERYYYY